MAELTVEKRHGRWRVQSGGRLLAGYSIGLYRPYIYPVLTPRGFSVTEESPVDHPHHQSIWLGQDEINGHNLWLNRPGCGRIESKELEARVNASGSVTFQQFNHWYAPDGDVLLAEQREVVIRPGEPGGRSLLIDLDSRRKAVVGAVRFGATKEAGLGIRVHDALDGEDSGCIVNSLGARGEAATFDHDADWVDYSGRFGEHAVGIALFPHPANLRCPWFTRDYGIIVYNPSRLQESILPPGEEIHERFRLVIHDGDSVEADIAGLYHDYRRESAD